MRSETIFVPMGVLALWTLGVALLVGLRRILAARARRLPPNAFALGEAPGVPDDVVLPNRNFMNLLEAPVLFYAVTIALYVAHQVTPGALATAWLYVALRLLHSTIHLTSNRVVHRLVPFALSNVVLVTMWVALLRAVG